MSDSDDEQVGHCKPPKKTQFQKGRSGNPSGRPRGARNKVTQADFETMFISEAYRQIEIAENGRPLKMTVIQAAVRRLGLEAARGDRKALQTLLTHVQSIEARTEANISEAIQTFIAYKKDWQTSFMRYDAEGKNVPNRYLIPKKSRWTWRHGKSSSMARATRSKKPNGTRLQSSSLTQGRPLRT